MIGADSRKQAKEKADAGATSDGADGAAPLLPRRQQGSEIGLDDLAVRLLDGEQDLGDTGHTDHDRNEAGPS